MMTFHSPGISPALWGLADGNNLALSPTLHKRKSHQGRNSNIKTPTLPRHCTDCERLQDHSSGLVNTWICAGLSKDNDGV